MDRKPLQALFQKSNLVSALLLTSVLVSGVAVSFVGHENRRLHNELQQELERRNKAQVEWGKLLLEQSSLTNPGRVEKIAREELDMEVPDAGRIKMVVP
ncbi:cell division protein FtsL [Endozoicomonas numazuensis]|uniref:cell division protein FtsL n=1 Tax=Endozoicomonas numazuensis TaxID=1137799 RepID=UPI0006919031|nr:cell division protein FtsL [Endozoicomonas numazuensis]